MGKVPPRRKSVPNLGPKVAKAEKPKGKPAVDKPVKVPFDLINFDHDTQSRTGIDQAVVDDYAEVIASMPPVTLFADGSGKYWIGDGWHRIAAASKAKAKAVLAVVKLGGKDEAIEHACGANAVHGLRRTRADVRRSIELMLIKLAHKNYADREIARRVGCSYTTVAAVRAELVASAQLGHSDDSKRTSIRNGNEVQVDISANQRKSETTADIAESLPVSGAETVDLDAPASGHTNLEEARQAAHDQVREFVEANAPREEESEEQPAEDAAPEEAPAKAPSSLPENAPDGVKVDEPDGPITEPQEQTAEEWLATLPAREGLKGKTRERFDLDALLYRGLQADRLAFLAAIDKALKRNDRECRAKGVRAGYTAGVFNWLRSRPHPREWKACPYCGGTGQGHDRERQVLATCGYCKGYGYYAGPKHWDQEDKG